MQCIYKFQGIVGVFTILLMAGCSSLDESKTRPDKLQLDSIPAKHPVVAAGDPSVDFRLRDKPSPQTVIHWAWRSTTPNHRRLQLQFKSRLLEWRRQLKFRFSKHSFSLRTKAWPSDKDYIKRRYKYFKKRNIHAVVMSHFEADAMKFYVYDPVTGDLLMEHTSTISVFQHKKGKDTAFHLNKKGNLLLPIREWQGKESRISWGKFRAFVKEMVRSCRGSRMFALAAVPGVKAYLNGRYVGRLPLDDFVVPEGKYNLEFRRTGYETQSHSFHSRAFGRQFYQVDYEDAGGDTRIRVTSYPEGEDVYIWDQWQGQTPFSIVGLRKETVPVRVHTKMGEDEFELFREDINLSRDHDVFKAFVRKYDYNFSGFKVGDTFDFWETLPVGPKSSLSAGSEGLRLKNPTSSQNEWIGVQSRMIVPYIHRINFKVSSHANSRFIVGLVPMSGEASYVFHDNGHYWAGSNAGSGVAYHKLKETKPDVDITLEYHHFDNELEFSVDGSAVLEKKLKLEGGYRIVFWGQSTGDSEGVLIKNMSIRSVGDHSE